MSYVAHVVCRASITEVQWLNKPNIRYRMFALLRHWTSVIPAVQTYITVYQWVGMTTRNNLTPHPKVAPNGMI